MQILLSVIPVFLLGAGFFYIFRLKGFYLLHPVRILRSVFKPKRSTGISPFKALTMALAGTLGVGNIVGVATALYLGGAGAVFWMVFSALVAMVLKYAEICLAVRHRRFDENGRPVGGAPYYIQDGLIAIGHPKLGKLLAIVFGLLCLVNTFTMGSMLQANAVAGALNEGFHIPLWLSGLVIGGFCILALKGGAARIASMTEKIVPLMTLGFLLLCAGVLILRYDRILPAVSEIFDKAFDLTSMSGGIAGFLTARGVRYGVMRGLVSNEAGCGTAPMAHAAAETDSPAEQGILGLVEVFVDTVLLCSVTALAILVSDSGPYAFGEDGVRTAQAAFSSVLGNWAGIFFAVSVFFFGVATILCWSHYGMTSVRAVLGTRKKLCGVFEKIFPVAFGISVVAGAVASPAGVWTLADGALAIMTIINLLTLLLMNREVAEETEIFIYPRGGKSQKQVKSDKSSRNLPRTG